MARGRGLDGGIEDAGDRLVMLATRREVTARPMQERVFAVLGNVGRPEPGRVVNTNDATTAGNHLGKICHGRLGVRETLRGELITNEDDGVGAFVDGFVLGPFVKDPGVDSVHVLGVLQYVRNEASAGFDFVGSGSVIARADDDHHIGGSQRECRQ